MLTMPLLVSDASGALDPHLALNTEPRMSPCEIWSRDLDNGPSQETVFRFGDFELAPSRRVLSQGGRPVRIGTRALDILTALVEDAGQLVTKAKLVQRAWPNTIVDEANLRVQLATLRKLLRSNDQGEPFIVTVAGQGYWFSARDLVRDTTSSCVNKPGRLQACG